MKEYREYNNQTYKTEVKYSLDGYQNQGRGYYLTIIPVEVDERSEYWRIDGTRHSLGINFLLKNCSRKSKKAEEESITRVINEGLIDKLVAQLNSYKK